MGWEPTVTPEVGSWYASAKSVQSRRSGKVVRRTFPGVERTGSEEKWSLPVISRPLTRSKM